jgi:hypothetical protein
VPLGVIFDAPRDAQPVLEHRVLSSGHLLGRIIEAFV